LNTCRIFKMPKNHPAPASLLTNIREAGSSLADSYVEHVLTFARMGL